MMFAPLGDSAVVVKLDVGIDAGLLAAVRELAAGWKREGPDGVTDVVPAQGTVTIFYEPARWVGEPGTPYERICRAITAVAEKIHAAREPKNAASGSDAARQMEIPVCYGGDEGPDLAEVAAHTGLTEAEVIARHCGAEYRVQAIGFAPGFPYLGGLPPELAVPRRATPRASVPAGSVGIGGAQTGVYPLASPGGWRLIGRTSLRFFDPQRAEPALLRVGDVVKFRAVRRETPRKTPEKKCHPIGDTWVEAEAAGLRIARAGMLTTVQDLGRTGHRAAGVPSGGAMDAFALRVANLLVGNAEDAAALELTLIGPEIIFSRDTVIAVTGAEFPGVPAWQPVTVKAGERLKLGPSVKGCRGYLAVAGGIKVEAVLGSRSTCLRAGFGGYDGRALHDGDVVGVTPAERSVEAHWQIDGRILPEYSAAVMVRVLRGAQAEEFDESWLGVEFRVTPQSDRMGMRLTGPVLVRTNGEELLSSAVGPGTVQVPPDGQPIVLMADAQTIGGYPQLAHVIGVDLPLMAQLRPGDTVRFQTVSLDEAHQLVLAREYALALLREGLAGKFH